MNGMKFWPRSSIHRRSLHSGALAPLAGSLLLAFCPLGSLAVAADIPGSAPTVTEADKVMYATGVTLGTGLEKLSVTPGEVSQIDRAIADVALHRPQAVDVAYYTQKMRELILARSKGTTAPSVASPAELDNIMYTLGVNVGASVRDLLLTPAEVSQLQKGFADQALGRALLVDMATYGPKVRPMAAAHVQAIADRNKAAGKSYLDKAATTPGARTLANGSVLITLKEGQGASPRARDSVLANVQSHYVDGTEVNGPSQVRGSLTGLPDCWNALQEMRAGGKAKLICPPATAYGDGWSLNIPPGSTLVYDVELLNVVSAPGQAAEAPKPDFSAAGH